MMSIHRPSWPAQPVTGVPIAVGSETGRRRRIWPKMVLPRTGVPSIKVPQSGCRWRAFRVWEFRGRPVVDSLFAYIDYLLTIVLISFSLFSRISYSMPVAIFLVLLISAVAIHFAGHVGTNHNVGTTWVGLAILAAIAFRFSLAIDAGEFSRRNDQDGVISA